MADIPKLDRLGYVLPVTDAANVVRIEVFNVDPRIDQTAQPTLMAALFPDHHDQISAQETEPPLGRPVYFVRRRPSNNLELRPRCDQTYWFRVSIRPPVQRGSPPKDER